MPVCRAGAVCTGHCAGNSAGAKSGQRRRRLTESLAGALHSQEEELLVDQKVSEPAEQDLPPAEDPAVTEFAVRNGQEVLTGGVVDVAYFNQGEAPWADAAYGPDEIRGYGCGPTSMAMLISSLKEETLDPAQAAREADEAGYCAPGAGSYLSIVEGMAGPYGLEAVSCPDLSAEELTQAAGFRQSVCCPVGKGAFYGWPGHSFCCVESRWRGRCWWRTPTAGSAA